MSLGLKARGYELAAPSSARLLRAVEELYGTRYQSGSFSLFNVGSGFHCLRSFFFFFSFRTLFALLPDLVWYVFVGFCLGRGCWVRVTMFISGLLNFRRCCALRLEGKSQVGSISICVSSEGHIPPCCTIFPQLSTFACASRHTYTLCTLVDRF
jgi:hypothetical protein